VASELADFLLARIAEDEALARTAGGAIRPPYPRWTFRTNNEGVRRSDGVPVTRHTWPQEAAHITRHDPTRVLAECEAKRRIAELHFPRSSNPNICNEDEDVLPCQTQRLLALPYVDHPDYRKEWKP
jgi:hypothetical protein